MKRILKIVGIATLLSALLVVSIGGVVSAANGPQAGEGAPYGDCTCECTCECLSEGECTCANYGEMGPHGVGAGNSYGEAGQHGKRSGKVE